MVFSITNLEANKQLLKTNNISTGSDNYGAGLGIMFISMTCIPLVAAIIALPILKLIQFHYRNEHDHYKDLSQDDWGSSKGRLMDERMGKSPAYDYPEYMFKTKKYSVEDLTRLEGERDRISYEQSLEKCNYLMKQLLYCLIPVVGFYYVATELQQTQEQQEKMVLLKLQSQCVSKHIQQLEAEQVKVDENQSAKQAADLLRKDQERLGLIPKAS